MIEASSHTVHRWIERAGTISFDVQGFPVRLPAAPAPTAERSGRVAGRLPVPADGRARNGAVPAPLRGRGRHDRRAGQDVRRDPGHARRRPRPAGHVRDRGMDPLERPAAVHRGGAASGDGPSGRRGQHGSDHRRRGAPVDGGSCRVAARPARRPEHRAPDHVESAGRTPNLCHRSRPAAPTDRPRAPAEAGHRAIRPPATSRPRRAGARASPTAGATSGARGSHGDHLGR